MDEEKGVAGMSCSSRLLSDMLRLSIHPPRKQASGNSQTDPATFEAVLPSNSDVSRLRIFVADELSPERSRQECCPSNSIPTLPRLVWRGSVLQDGQSLGATGLRDGDHVYAVPPPTQQSAASPARSPAQVLGDEAFSQIFVAQIDGAASDGVDLADQFSRLVRSNAQLRSTFERHPMLNQLLERPQDLRQAVNDLRSNGVRQELIRNMDLEMRRLETIPRGFEVLRNHWEEQNRMLQDLAEVVENGTSEKRSRASDYYDVVADSHARPRTEAMPDAWNCSRGRSQAHGIGEHGGGSKPSDGCSDEPSEEETRKADEELLNHVVLPWEALFDPSALALLRQDETTQLLLQAMATSVGVDLDTQEETLRWPILKFTVFPTPASMVLGDGSDELLENSTLESSVPAQQTSFGTDSCIDGSMPMANCWQVVETTESHSLGDDTHIVIATDVDACRSMCLKSGYTGFLLCRGVARFFKEASVSLGIDDLQKSSSIGGVSAQLHLAPTVKRQLPELPAACATDEAAEQRWQCELSDLQRIGFADRAANIHALKVCGGNLDRAINHLLM